MRMVIPPISALITDPEYKCERTKAIDKLIKETHYD